MKRDTIPLFDGQIKANRIGQFTRLGTTFDIVRPGYDSQGRRRNGWTQFVHDGVPMFEVKMQAELDVAFDQFDAQWAKHIQDNPLVLAMALKACRKERLHKFKDGKSGETLAPSLTHDGRDEGKLYPS